MGCRQVQNRIIGVTDLILAMIAKLNLGSQLIQLYTQLPPTVFDVAREIYNLNIGGICKMRLKHTENFFQKPCQENRIMSTV